MAQNKIVVRYADGRVQKGITMDFIPGKETFHIMPSISIQGEKLMEIHCDELKAVFFVRDYAGNPAYTDKKSFEPSQPVAGRKMKVHFKDGELLIGATQAYQPGRMGFFLAPADPQSNIERCYVITRATKDIQFIS
jgi:hypothetical protein